MKYLEHIIMALALVSAPFVASCSVDSDDSTGLPGSGGTVTSDDDDDNNDDDDAQLTIDDVLDALPDWNLLKLVYPGTTAPSLKLTAQTVGSPSLLYGYGATLVNSINGGLYDILQALWWLANQSLPTIDGLIATWDTVDYEGVSYDLSVELDPDAGLFNIELQATLADSGIPSETILVATYVPAGEESDASGTLDLYYSTYHGIADNDLNGLLEIDWEMSGDDFLMEITATDFVSQAGADAANGFYKYERDTVNDGGSLQFTVITNLSTLPVGDSGAEETFDLKGRWTSDHAGRGDARISGGDLGALIANLSECFDESQDVVWEQWLLNSIEQSSSGDETDCVFATSELPDWVE